MLDKTGRSRALCAVDGVGPLRDHGRMVDERSPAPGEAAEDLRLGSLLARAGLLPREKLDQALSRQASSNARLGELLVAMGVLDAFELGAVLGLQEDLRAGRAEELIRFLSVRLDDLKSAPPAAGERLRLGAMLVEAGVIDERTLQEAIERQRGTGLKLGETLVDAGAITPQTLSDFLARQRRLLAVAMAAASVLSPALPGLALAAGSHRIQVQATVVRHAAISRLRAPQSLTITAQDIERGYVEPEQPIELDIRTNDATGVLVGMTVNSPLLHSAEFLGAGDYPAAGTVFVAKQGHGLSTQTLRLRARFRLGSGAVPGVISWPVALFISPA